MGSCTFQLSFASGMLGADSQVSFEASASEERSLDGPLTETYSGASVEKSGAVACLEIAVCPLLEKNFNALEIVDF